MVKQQFMTNKTTFGSRLFSIVVVSVYFVIASCSTPSDQAGGEVIEQHAGALQTPRKQNDSPSCCMKIPSRFGHVTTGMEPEKSKSVQNANH